MKSFKNFNEAVKGQDTESRKEGAKERAAEKKSGKIRKNTLDPKEYATQQKKSIEWHDKRTKGRYSPGQVTDVHEVAPPGWGHTKAEKEKTDPSKPKSKIGGTAAAFKRALDRGDFKGLPGDKTKKEKTASMFKLMWSMKKKGDKPHYKPGTDEKYKKYQEEETSPMPNVSSKDKGAIKKRAKNLFKRDLTGEHQSVNETLSGKDVKKLAKASVLSTSDDPRDQDRARARQVDVDYKDLVRQLKAKRRKKVKEGFVIEREDSPYEKASDKALDKKYGYGTSHDKGPKTGFGRASNRNTAAAVLKDIRRRKSKSTAETRADAAHKGWSATARTSKDQTPEKKATRKKLADTPYKKLPKDEQEKDQVAADAVKKEYDKRKKNESFEIDKDAHNKAKKKAKLRNLAKGNTNPNEKAAAEKKAGGPKLYGEGKTWDAWKKAATSALKKKKEERKAQPATDAGARARRKLKDKEHNKYVNFLHADDD